MFTIKLFYESGQKGFWEAETVNVMNNDRTLYINGGGDKGEILELNGSENVYIENSQGKTVHLIKAHSPQDTVSSSDK